MFLIFKKNIYKKILFNKIKIINHSFLMIKTKERKNLNTSLINLKIFHLLKKEVRFHDSDYLAL